MYRKHALEENLRILTHHWPPPRRQLVRHYALQGAPRALRPCGPAASCGTAPRRPAQPAFADVARCSCLPIKTIASILGNETARLHVALATHKRQHDISGARELSEVQGGVRVCGGPRQ